MSYQDRSSSSSEARLNANRENALHSTGPRTLAGKSISSQNAIRTALTGRTVLLPTDDADRYEQHLQAFRNEIEPVGQRETILTQSVADIAWRIERVASFEMAIYAKGRAYFAGGYSEEPAELRPQLIEFDIYQTNERELRNLQLQDSRLRRQRDRDTAEIRHLQSERKRLLEERLELAAYTYRKAKEEQKAFDPASLGFVISNSEIEAYIAIRKARRNIAIASGADAAPSRNRLKVS